MSHWTERIFKDYQSEPKGQPLQGRAERRRNDFDLAALIAELAHADPQTRKRAARAIGLLHERDGVAALITALTDRDEQVRHTAREALNSFTLTAREQDAVRRAVVPPT